MRYCLFLMVGYIFLIFIHNNCSMRLEDTSAIIEQLHGFKQQWHNLSQSQFQFQFEEEDNEKLRITSLIEFAEIIIEERCKNNPKEITTSLHDFFEKTIKITPQSKKLECFINLPKEHLPQDFYSCDESDYATNTNNSTQCSSLSSPILTPQPERKLFPITSSYLQNDSSSKKSLLTKLSPNESLIQKVCDELSTMEKKDIASILEVAQKKKSKKETWL